MRILFVSANPDWTPRLDLGDEMRTLLQSLKGHDIRLMLLPAAQPEDLKIAIESNDIDIVHFSGHATAEDGLLFRNKDGQKVAISPAELRELIDGRNIKLAVLNACSTKATAESIADSVGAIIATEETLDDTAAKMLTKVFYSTLGNGESIETAFSAANQAIDAAELKNVYTQAGGNFDQNLFEPDKEWEGETTIEGQSTWDKYFYVTYLDQQIESAQQDIARNRRWLFILLALGLLLIPAIWISTGFEWSNLLPTVKDNWDFLVGQPLLDWMLAVGAGIPAVISLMQSRLMIQGNESLSSLIQLKEMVKNSDEMSPDLRSQLQAILDQSLRGATI